VKQLVAVAVFAVATFAGAERACAQAAPVSLQEQHVIGSAELDLLRADIRSQKKQLIARNLKLSDVEATKFWPLYDEYAADLTRINDRKFAVLQRYADSFAVLTDDEALKLLRDWLAVETDISKLRETYIAKVSKVLSGRNTASFFQLERRAAMLVDLQLSAKTPLAQGK
jgi:hypothetical protein